MKTLKEMDHEAVRCDEMVDWDVENKMPGVKATCCVCAGHDCDAAKAERLKLLWVETANKLPDSFRPVIGLMEYSGALTMRIVMLCDPQNAYRDQCWKTIEGNGTSVPIYWMPLPNPPAQFLKP